MSMNRQQVLKRLEEHQQDLQRYHVKRLGLFGSYAREENTETSDLDFIVEFKEKSFDNYMDLKFYLEKLFHKQVDLIIEESLKPALKYVKEEAVYAKVL